MNILMITLLMAAQPQQPAPPDYVQKNVAQAFADPKTWERSAKADVLLTKHCIKPGQSDAAKKNLIKK